jgi:two-component system response regulator DesR
VTVRLVLAEDPPPHADGPVRLLEREPDLQVVARCGDGETVPWAVRVFRPDVLLLGLDLPPGGVEVLRRLAREGAMPRVVVLAADPEEDGLLEAVSLGVRGVVPPAAAAGQLARCVRAVHGGGRWLDPGLVGRALDRFLAGEAARRRSGGAGGGEAEVREPRQHVPPAVPGVDGGDPRRVA